HTSHCFGFFFGGSFIPCCSAFLRQSAHWKTPGARWAFGSSPSGISCTFGAGRGDEDGDLQNSVARLDLVAILQVTLAECELGSLFGRHVTLAAADQLSVQASSVETSEVADSYIRRIYVQQTVMPGNRLVILVVRKPGRAVPGASEDSRVPLFKGE